MKSNLSSGNSSAGERNAEPALLTRMSTRPYVSATQSASGVDGRLVGDVEVRTRAVPPWLGDPSRWSPRAPSSLTSSEHDRHAGLGIADRDRRAEAAAASGHHCHATREVEQASDEVGGDGEPILRLLGHFRRLGIVRVLGQRHHVHVEVAEQGQRADRGVKDGRVRCVPEAVVRRPSGNAPQSFDPALLAQLPGSDGLFGQQALLLVGIDVHRPVDLDVHQEFHSRLLPQPMRPCQVCSPCSSSGIRHSCPP